MPRVHVEICTPQDPTNPSYLTYFVCMTSLGCLICFLVCFELCTHAVAWEEVLACVFFYCRLSLSVMTEQDFTLT